MIDIIMTKIVPVNFIFLIGYFLKNRNIMKEEDGGVFLKFTFYILIPAMLFNSTRKMELSLGVLLYPALIAIVHGIMYMVGVFTYKVFKCTQEERPVVVSSLMVMNGGFIIPFFIAFYGQKEVWRVGVFDFGNALITFSIIYSIFLNNKAKSKKLDFKRALYVFKSPPVVGIIIGLMFNILNIRTHETINIIASNLTALVGPMMMLALGLYFNPKVPNKILTFSLIFIKFIIGGTIATILSYVFGLTGLTRIALYLMACSPVGTNILTFSILSDSDMSLASGIVSYSTLLNLFMIPALLMFLSI